MPSNRNFLFQVFICSFYGLQTPLTPDISVSWKALTTLLLWPAVRAVSSLTFRQGERPILFIIMTSLYW